MNNKKLEQSKKEMLKSMYKFLQELEKEGANLTNYPSYLPSLDDVVSDLEKIKIIKG